MLSCLGWNTKFQIRNFLHGDISSDKLLMPLSEQAFWKARNSVIQVALVSNKSLNLHVNVKLPCRRSSDLKVIRCISEYRGHDSNKKLSDITN